MNELELLKASVILFTNFVQGRYFDAEQGARIFKQWRKDEEGISQIGIRAL